MRFLHHLTGWIPILFLLLDLSEAEDEHHKRGPSGFTGVRGKKSIPDSAYAASDDVDNTIDLRTEDTAVSQGSVTTSPNYVVEKRAPMGFFGMRGKKPWNYPWYPEEMYKRAPMGFVGMRGKKETDYDDDEDWAYADEPSKRAMGFFGMRGKKYFVQPDGLQSDKRAPMGFIGMRGKKEFENAPGYFEDKRAPSGFFGMRGKKQLGFFGMRGKKYPFEFRGKFVGVRGKKSQNIRVPNNYYEDSSDLARLRDNLDINQLMLLLTEQNEAERNNL